jgi:hypothetical protein
MAGLPVDSRGYVVPWFVAWIDVHAENCNCRRLRTGDEIELAGCNCKPERMPEFRAMDQVKFVRAIRERLCWVCGQRLGTNLAFVIGPMCAINRVSSEPPSHYECAAWSARNCPFLSRPQMVRRETGPGADYQEIKHNVAGEMIPRNPGVTLVWVCRSYERFSDGKRGTLLEIGDPERVEWWCCGRPATRAEVMESVESGYPLLLETAKGQRGAVEELTRQRVQAEALYPA